MKDTAAGQLRGLIEKLDPERRQVMRSVRSALRTRLPTANELVYEYRDSLVISYSPTERGIDAVVAIAARKEGVRLYFTNGPELPDPNRLLQGSGTKTRFIEVATARRLAHPDVEALIAASSDRATVPLPAAGRRRVAIRSGATKQSPARSAKR